MKYCPVCNQNKKSSEFSKNAARKDGLHSVCRECRIPILRDAHLRRKYNLTQKEYMQIHNAQKGVCAICKQPETRISKSGTIAPLSVDHNHSTGEVRALLCDDCNNGIERFKEDPVKLQAAIDYLFEHGISVSLSIEPLDFEVLRG